MDSHWCVVKWRVKGILLKDIDELPSVLAQVIACPRVGSDFFEQHRCVISRTSAAAFHVLSQMRQCAGKHSIGCLLMLGDLMVHANAPLEWTKNCWLYLLALDRMKARVGFRCGLVFLCHR